MVDFTALFCGAYVCAIHAAGTTAEHLSIREIVVWWWVRDNEVGVVTEDVECARVGRRDGSCDSLGKPRIHDADIALYYTSV